ncbi:cyclopropane-fatty-acyl-phospholipid synthase family protein [Arenibaculum sp.]|jgi:cyclopropane-fatty-acyl-phospholipid synthase|uniref:cyclopropane-fatty-acyl-phospholipid synthase family protein n=1 Tax=Arenibaculum sp. TaxID=2865862 RepID=UPI002E165931|nr:cyclopropane-fatty-acyl-phospholipid synthase family protein [Arenibaculum sp.]
MLFRKMLEVVIHEGSLGVVDDRGRRSDFGSGQPHAVLRVHDPALEWTIPFNPPLRFAEAYMDGRLTVEEGTIEDVVRIFARNYGRLERHPLVRAGFAVARQTRRLKQHNPVGKAQRNVAHHYDLSEALYRLFLDEDMQYSCAYFAEPEMSLEEAQRAKKRHLAAKLHLDRPGLSVLDIGSGWGGLGLHLAGEFGCDVTGVTLSAEQHRVSEQRARERGLSDRARFQLRDYRELDRKFDRIVSVGMFEHVGKRNYDEYFAKVADLLTDDGIAVIHSIGRFNEPGPINPFIRKYIFPGADVPALSEVTPAAEKSGLFMTDIEILRLHYAETLRHWRQRFNANRDRIREIYDDRFCRMWDLYLVGCEYGFRLQGMMVFQMQLTKRQETLPLTRDYMYRAPAGVASAGIRAAE